MCTSEASSVSVSGEARQWEYTTGSGQETVAVEVRFVPQVGDEMLVMIRDRSRERRLEAEILEVTAHEQRRLGQELHDGLGQELAGLSYISRVLARKLASEAPEAHAIAERLHDGIEAAIGQTHAIAHGLNPVALEREGLLVALEELTRRVEEVYDVYCRLEHRGDVTLADPTVAHHLYRIAQEAIHNAIKHTDSEAIEVLLVREPTTLVLEVADQGAGLPQEAMQGSGMGLATMRYRANLIGASLHLRDRPRNGATLVCRLPLPVEQNADPPTPVP